MESYVPIRGRREWRDGPDVDEALLHEEKGDTRWIFVRPDRTLGSVDIKDRSRITAKRQPNINYEAFPTMTADEKTAAIEAGTEKQLSMEFGAAKWRSRGSVRAYF